MHVLTSTLLRQHSFTPSWITSAIDIPSGIIIDCQFTTTSSAPIYLSSLTCYDGKVSISFTQGDSVCAYADNLSWSSITPLTVLGDVLSATVETGRIPTANINKTFAPGAAEVTSSHINVVASPLTNTGELHIIQDGVDTKHNFSGDLTVNLGGSLQGDCTSGSLVISMTDSDYLDYTRIGTDVIRNSAKVTSINGVATDSGNLSINVYYQGVLLPVIRRADNWIELDSSWIPFCPGFEDILDSYIAPDTHIGYLPLDDLYDSTGRNTLLAVNKLYGKPGDQTLGLTDIDPMVDGINSK